MVTVFNYYHGEEGEVVHSNWIIGKRKLIYSIQLRGNPHRAFVLEHTGSDISIDPILKPGDKTVLVRLGQYSAIWVNKGAEFHPEVEQAIERARERKQYFLRYRNIVSYSRFLATLFVLRIAARTRIPVRLSEPVEKPSTLSITPITVFLSYRSTNVLLAQEFYNNLKRDAKVDVWIDQERQHQVPPEHEHAIASWLQNAIDSCQLFMVLLTEESVNSDWVRNEIIWATEKAQRDDSFHLIVLKLGQVKLPEVARLAQCVLDSESLSYYEMVEETYAAVYQRPGRREWLEEQRLRGWPGITREQTSNYRPPLTDCGRAISLDWIRTADTIHWTLEFEKDSGNERVKGSGQAEVVDLGIRPGDLVGVLEDPHNHRRIYMRSGDLSLSPDEVFQNYVRYLPYRSWDDAPRTLAARISNLLLFVCGLLIIGLTEYFVVSNAIRTASTMEPLPGLDARNSAIFLTILSTELGAYILIRALGQVVFYARPSEFADRSGKSALLYSAKALGSLGVALFLDPLLNFLIFVLLYGFTIGTILLLLEAALGYDMTLVLAYGATIGYGFYVLDEVFPFWDLIKETWPSRSKA
jgi:hypothetical protein